VEQRRAFTSALLAILTVSAAACASSENNPGTSAAPPQPTATQSVPTTGQAATPLDFVSKRYDFRVTLTKDWSETDAAVVWDGKMLQGADSPAFANFTDPATGRDLVVGAAAVAKGTRLAQWRAAMVRAAPPVCSDSSSAGTTSLAGGPALTWTSTCSDGYDVIKLAALHGDRGYMVFLPSTAANDDAVDRSMFESIRRSFRFTR
jgi:hypothetical protein